MNVIDYGAQDSSGGERGDEDSPADVATLIRRVLRMQERHREGGIDPEVNVDDQQPESEARLIATPESGAGTNRPRCPARPRRLAGLAASMPLSGGRRWRVTAGSAVHQDGLPEAQGRSPAREAPGRPTISWITGKAIEEVASWQPPGSGYTP